jgi:hypothetical protein
MYTLLRKHVQRAANGADDAMGCVIELFDSFLADSLTLWNAGNQPPGQLSWCRSEKDCLAGDETFELPMSLPRTTCKGPLIWVQSSSILSMPFLTMTYLSWHFRLSFAIIFFTLNKI